MEEEKKNTSEEELKVLLASVLARQGEFEEYGDNDEVEIDWMDILSKLLNGWKLIAIVTFLFAVLGVGVALIKKHTYNVTSTLAPEVAGKSSSSSSLSGIASMLGIGNVGLGNTSDALNITLFPEISSSTPFLVSLLEVPVTPYVSPKKLKEGKKPAETVSLYDYLTRDTGGIETWLKSLLPQEEEADSIFLINHLTEKQAEVIKGLRKCIGADVDKKTGVTTVSVTMTDPDIATQLADTVCQRLQDYIINYRTKKAKEDLDYYTKLSDEAKAQMVKAQAAYAQSVDFDRSVILQSVNSVKERLQAEAQLAQQLYQQMETQKEAAKAKYQELKPVFAVIQPATFPQKPAESRKTIVLIFAFLGLILSAGWVAVGKNLLTKMKSAIQAAKNTEKREAE